MDNVLLPQPYLLPEYPGDDYPHFMEAYEKLSGIRLDLYKENQMKRRISTLIARKNLHTYSEFLALLASDPAELKSFGEYITINVTEFFRTPDQWDHFVEEALSGLVNTRKEPLRIWSCACATGEEPYSLAMSMREHFPRTRFRILASDLNDAVLDRARAGIFDFRAMQTLPEELREKYFIRAGQSWQASDEIRSDVEFRRLDILRDEYPADCDLIVCRNVLIYFTEEAKQMIYEHFRQSLSPGGFLFTGNTEQIIYYRELGMQKLKTFLYRKQ